MSTIIYHNPRCSKSRQTLEIIRQSGIEPQIIKYLDTPLNTKEISNLLERLNIKPRAAMRTKETAYKDNNLGHSEVTCDQLITAMAENPALIERPIVVTDKGIRICRPPELVKEVL